MSEVLKLDSVCKSYSSPAGGRINILSPTEKERNTSRPSGIKKTLYKMHSTDLPAESMKSKIYLHNKTTHHADNQYITSQNRTFSLPPSYPVRIKFAPASLYGTEHRAKQAETGMV